MKKYILFALMLLVIICTLGLPIVHNPCKWYQLPYIPGLEDKIRIIVFHVPTAWISVLAYFSSFIYSLKFIHKRNIYDDLKSYAAIKIGTLFTILATITGSIWAKFTWGSFWNWDPRETSILALLLIYFAIIALRSAISDIQKKAILSSAYSIISFVTVPFLIFIIPRIMDGLHPGSSNDTTSGPIVSYKISSILLVLFVASLSSFTLYYWWLWKLTYKSLKLEMQIEELKCEFNNE